jgi:Fic family protein
MRTKPPATPKTYIWQSASWPNLSFELDRLVPALDAARQQQARLIGQIEAIDLAPKQELIGELWVTDTLATAAIEGEKLELNSVRSSVHRRLGLGEESIRDRKVEGLVDVLQDASTQFLDPLTKERLCNWHAGLFPSGRSGIYKILVGDYRKHSDPMQIVSGLPGREIVHYAAPPSNHVSKEMVKLLKWFEKTRPQLGKAPKLNGLIRAAIAHLWFETIHPFEDGNGRIGRAVMDLAIAQDLNNSTRMFNMSRQFLESRKEYYDALNAAQVGGTDITTWVHWFLRTFELACLNSQGVVQQALLKAAYWHRAAQQGLNERQTKVLRRLMDAGDGGFLGGMTADKYCKITGASKATATRDLVSLLTSQLLVIEGVGRATRYAIAVQGWNQQNIKIK